MKLCDILQNRNLPDIEIAGISSDSRAVRKNFLFFALSGQRHNGCEFITDAIRHGASAIVLPKGASKPASLQELAVEWIETENPRLMLAQAASRFYAAQPETVVAVTGTNGKTSVVNFVRQIWEKLDYNAASLGTLGLQGNHVEPLNEVSAMTTPDPRILYARLAQLAETGINHLAMEASSHGLNQHRLDGIRFKAAGFTNLTRDHLDYHETMERYAAAKARLFTDLLRADGVAVLNCDMAGCEEFSTTLRQRGITVWTYGEKGHDIKIFSREAVPYGQKLKLEILGREASFTLPLVGAFQVMNVLCAIGLVLAQDKDRLEEVIAILPQLHGVEGRLEYVPGHPKGAAVYVDYAHTPDALEHVLKALRPHTDGKLVCVFGCGGDRDRGKRPLMGKITSELADIAIITDDNPRTEKAEVIRAEIKQAAPDALEIGDRRTAIAEALKLCNSGDILVIAGKGHEQGQIIGSHVEPFDDVTEAQTAIQAMGRG